MKITCLLLLLWVPGYAQSDSLQVAKGLLRKMVKLDSLKSAKIALCDAELAFVTLRYQSLLDKSEALAQSNIALTDSLSSLNAKSAALVSASQALATENQRNVQQLSRQIASERKKRWLWMAIGLGSGILLFGLVN